MRIMQRIKEYIYQHHDWPDFYWESDKVLNELSSARNHQGRLLGKMEAMGFDLQREAVLDTLTLDILKSSEIEGEYLNSDQVRSSIARNLGIEIAGMVASDRNVDGIVETMLDATQNCFEPLTKDRLCGWHASLFPAGRSGMFKIVTADWRKDSKGPMQVVSGRIGKEVVHFEAPAADKVDLEMKEFLYWLNNNSKLDLVLKAAVAHFWFVTIHPFEDGNGRIARAISDMLLARSDQSNQRFYSMSAQIRAERKDYYRILEKTQKGDLDITEWIIWFLKCLDRSVLESDKILEKVLVKANFWRDHPGTSMNDRQRKLANKLLESFKGKMTSSKWAKIAKCSKDTAVRDINDLIEKNVLIKEEAGGRSTSYILKKN